MAVRLDPDVVEHFKAGGPGWQSRINDALAGLVRKRGLEELVLNNAVVRYRPSLQTLRLNRVSLDDELYQAFTDGMTNASKITGHDQPAELGGAWPEPAAAEALLAELAAFETLAKGKAQVTEKNRKIATKPPPPGS